MGSFVDSAGGVMDRIVTYILDPLILLLFSVGFLVFVWGLTVFMYNIGDPGSEDRQKGIRHMIYGLIGMFIMIGVQGIIGILDDTFGLNLNNPGPGGGGIQRNSAETNVFFDTNR